MLQAFASRKSQLAWDASEKFLSLEAVLVYTCFLVLGEIREGVCRQFWQVLSGAPDQVYTNKQ